MLLLGGVDDVFVELVFISEDVLLVLGTVLLDFFEEGVLVTSVSCNEELPEDDSLLVVLELASESVMGQ